MGVAAYIGAQEQAKLGREQLAEAEGIDTTRPVYEIPKEITQQQGLYRGMASQAFLPGQAQMEDKLGAAASTGIGAAQRAGGSASDVIGAATNISANQMRSINDLTIANAQQRRQSQGLYGQSLGLMAEYQDQAFGINEMEPYRNAVERKEALTAAGIANKQALYETAERENSQMASIFTGMSGGGGGSGGGGVDYQTELQTGQPSQGGGYGGYDGYGIT